jgi:hypothetical protein
MVVVEALANGFGLPELGQLIKATTAVVAMPQRAIMAAAAVVVLALVVWGLMQLLIIPHIFTAALAALGQEALPPVAFTLAAAVAAVILSHLVG